MRRLLCVKSGERESSVTESRDISEADARAIILNHGVKFLGSDSLPTIEDAAPSAKRPRRGHVVVQLPEDDRLAIKLEGAGYYLVRGMDPQEVPKYVR